MKRENLKLAVTLLISVILFSCESDDQSPLANGYDSLDVISAQASVQDGQWRVSEFRDDDDDNEYQTIDFEGYTFDFGADGLVTATIGDQVFTGIWRIELEDDDDDDDDDDDRDEMEFELKFDIDNGPLEEISEDWDVLEYSDTLIRLGDEDDDDDDELLTFEKI